MTVAAAVPAVPSARALTPVGEEALRGLSAMPKTLSPWLFYDERGSELFERITELPEYYPTRTERGILAEHADEILQQASGTERFSLIELGAGTASKTGLLLRAALRLQTSVAYHPIDVSASALDEAKTHLERELPGVEVYPQVADYTEGLGRATEGPERHLVLYIGSSIGNFDPENAEALLQSVRRQLRAGDTLLLGADQAPGASKTQSMLEAAYDDAQGVTAAFNLNVLARLNRELGADFALERFRHRALWNAAASRIEMHLLSTEQQHVRIPALDLTLHFAADETIHTENSYKFSDARLAELLQATGFAQQQRWKDAAGWFGVYLARAV
jgi:L-histidine Nalpha-methyltransferase